ncbi:hypothetical protein ACFWY5_28300 [Nonomuraea sp. NPDC059007]|uniref:hypothetical protein n=1 Tax=Nonomuraea sp. NPDC059007 TaxID=3346692 RepID=UPI0036BFAE2C
MNGQHLMRIARKGPEQFVDPAYIVNSFEGACGIYLSALDLVVLSLWGMATAPLDIQQATAVSSVATRREMHPLTGLDDDAAKVTLARPVAHTVDQNKTVDHDLFTFSLVIGVDRPETEAKKTATKIRIAHADRASSQVSRPADTGLTQRPRVTRRLLHRVAIMRALVP